MPVRSNSKGFNDKKILNPFSNSLLERNVFGESVHMLKKWFSVGKKSEE